MRGSDYADLRAFAAVAMEGNFARAAGRLRLSPSTLSQTIRELEQRLGVRLLNRTTRSMSLTDAGTQLLARLTPALEALDAAVQHAASLRDRPAGRLRVSAPRLAFELHLEPLLGRFHEDYPDIVLDLTIDDAVTGIAATGADVGIRLGELLEQDVVAVRLGGSLVQVAFASPAYLERHGCPDTPADLHAHRCINWRQPGSTGVYDWEFQRGGEWFAVAVSGPLVVSDRRAAVSAALAGVGIGFWIEERIRPWVAQRRLTILLQDWSAPFPGFHAYYQKQRVTPATVKAFIDFLRTSVPDEADPARIMRASPSTVCG